MSATHGLAVSGLASSPYGVAVGGTDFANFGVNFNYGIPSAYWSLSNGPNQASALGYIPETTWNSTCTNNAFVILGYGSSAEASCNNSHALNWVETIGGGGGRSSCITSDSANTSSCTGGYTKPSWQSAPGVPADGARDIPDVSLFASSGFMDSAYIVCESDQVSSRSCYLNSTTNFLGVGGTSVSAPAFAGIMALVNQYTESTGQGNANYVLYRLASLPPQTALNCNSSATPDSGCIFHDVTSGTIAVPCARNSPNCNFTNGSYTYGVLSGYDAGTGYDLATGLGSLNAYNLVHNWSLATFTPTTTNLTLNGGNSVNITHGQNVPVAIQVTSGAGTPTGPVSLIATSGARQGVDGFTLQNGSVSSSTNQLPGGSYNLVAQYSGDGKFGGSISSPPAAVSVSPEDSTTSASVLTLVPNGGSYSFVPFSSGPYGSFIYLRGDVSGVVSAGHVAATGCISFSDNGTQISGGSTGCSFPLNSLSSTETLNGLMTFIPGPHSIAASYGGDPSYNPSSTSAPANFTIALAPVQTALEPFPSVVTFDNNTLGMIADISASVGFNPLTKTFGGIALPTGTITIYAGTTQIGSPFAIRGNVDVQSQTLTGRSATIFRGVDFLLGHNMVTAEYSGDSNYAGSTSSPSAMFVGYPTSTSVSESKDTLMLGENVTFTAQVTTSQVGGPPITGAFQFTVDDENVGTPISMSNGQAVYTTNSLPVGPHGVRALYSGDNNYIASTGSNSVAVLAPDFVLSPPGNLSQVTIPGPGQSSSPIVLSVAGVNGYNGTINFTPVSCSITPGGSESSCSFNPASVTGSGTTQVTIATTAPHTLSMVSVRRLGGPNRLLMIGIVAAALVVLLVSEARKRRWSLVCGMILVFAIASTATNCGGGGSSGGALPDPGTPTNVPYTVTVNATATGTQTTHATSFTFLVQ